MPLELLLLLPPLVPLELLLLLSPPLLSLELLLLLPPPLLSLELLLLLPRLSSASSRHRSRQNLLQREKY